MYEGWGTGVERDGGVCMKGGGQELKGMGEYA